MADKERRCPHAGTCKQKISQHNFKTFCSGLSHPEVSFRDCIFFQAMLPRRKPSDWLKPPEGTRRGADTRDKNEMRLAGEEGGWGPMSKPRRRRKNSRVAAIGVSGSTATTAAEVSEIEVKRVQNLIRDAIDFLREAGATDEEIAAAFFSEVIEILSSYPEKERKAALRRIDEGSGRGAE